MNKSSYTLSHMIRPGELITYRQLTSVPTGENGDPLVRASAYDSSIIEQYEKFDMLSYTGQEIYVRETVARKLAAVAGNLANKDFRLKIAYGYRHPHVQEKYFTVRKDTLKKEGTSLTEAALDEATHAFVAVPAVAGHPTGAAIDLTITDSEGNNLDMGTGIADYTDPEKIRTFSANLTSNQRSNRALLHGLMVQEGFAPFYGEWWHFSYGDREWAAVYGRPSSLYEPINFTVAEEGAGPPGNS